MPLHKRKPVDLINNPVDVNQNDCNVFYIDSTSEIFLDYASYISRLFFLRQHIFQCSVSGKANLTYSQALASEKSEALKMQARFQPAIRGPILRCASFQVMGRLDNLIDVIYDRFKSRFWPGESVFVDLSGEKYFARIVNVYPPKELIEQIQDTKEPESKKFKVEDDDNKDFNGVKANDLHKIGIDLDIPLNEADATDPPLSYYYTIQLAGEDDKFSGSYMELKAASLSRDRLMFSKAILRRFLRESLVREPLIGAPWRVKPSIAKMFNIPEEPTDEMKNKNDEIRKNKLNERRKMFEGKPMPKREKEAKPATPIKPQHHPEPKHESNAELLKIIQAAKNLEKKKSTKYPMEDLNIILTRREINARSKENSLVRPYPNKPINDKNEIFDSILQTWSFLNIFEHVLQLSAFTLDDFINVLNHSQTNGDQVPELLSEIHVCLVNMLIRERDGIEGMTDLPLNESAQKDSDWCLKVIDRYGNQWSRKQISDNNERRNLWLRVTIGCLRNHITNETHIQWKRIYSHLFDVKENEEENNNNNKSKSTTSSPLSSIDDIMPEDRYFSLKLEDKLLFISSLCARVKMSKYIRSLIDSAEPQLTELRKERVEVNRERKKLLGEKVDVKQDSQTPATNNLNNTTTATPNQQQKQQAIPDDNSDDLSEPEQPKDEEDEENEEDEEEYDQLASDNESNVHLDDSESIDTKSKISNNNKFMNKKVNDTNYKISKKPEEAIVDLGNRIEEIDNEFRATTGILRIKPLGEDRFFNTYWFFDGYGTTPLQGTSKEPVEFYETGRLFVHRPYLPDPALSTVSHNVISKLMGDNEIKVEKNEELFMKIEQQLSNDINKRRVEEEGIDSGLEPGDWGVYDSMEEIERLFNWLQHKGNRELALRNTLQRWWPWIEKSVKTRKSVLESKKEDLMELDEGNKSKPVIHPHSNLPGGGLYMNWTNKRRQQIQ